jgi:hypothetical protein
MLGGGKSLQDERFCEPRAAERKIARTLTRAPNSGKFGCDAPQRIMWRFLNALVPALNALLANWRPAAATQSLSPS